MQDSGRKTKRPRISSVRNRRTDVAAPNDNPRFSTNSWTANQQESSSASAFAPPVLPIAWPIAPLISLPMAPSNVPPMVPSIVPPMAPSVSPPKAPSVVLPIAPPIDPIYELQRTLRAHWKPPLPVEESDPLTILQRQMAEAKAMRAGQIHPHPPLPRDAPIPSSGPEHSKKATSIKLSNNIILIGPSQPSRPSPVDPERTMSVPNNRPQSHPPSGTKLSHSSKTDYPARPPPTQKGLLKPVQQKPMVPKHSQAKPNRLPKRPQSSSDEVEVVADLRPISEPNSQTGPARPGRVPHPQTAGPSESDEETPLPAALIKREPQDVELPQSTSGASSDVIDLVDSDDDLPVARSKQDSCRHSLSRIYKKNPHFAPRRIETPPSHIIDRWRDLLLRGHRREDLVYEDIELARDFQNTLQIPVNFRFGMGDLRSFHNAFSVRHTYASSDEYQEKMAQCLNSRTVQLQGELQRLVQNEEVLSDLEQLRIELQDILNPPP